VQRDLKDYAAAEGSLSDAIAIYRETFKAPHRFTAYALGYLAGIAQDRGDLSEAERLSEESTSTMEQALGPAHADTLAAVAGQAQILEASRAHQRALGLFDQILSRATTATPPLRSALAHQGRGRCLLALGHVAEAVGEHTMALAAIEAIDAASPTTTQRLKKAREELAKAQEALEAPK
jgi:tetratricopeptide (TPR) repeat protein